MSGHVNDSAWGPKKFRFALLLQAVTFSWQKEKSQFEFKRTHYIEERGSKKASSEEVPLILRAIDTFSSVGPKSDKYAEIIL